jgi:hypothetical protein
MSESDPDYDYYCVDCQGIVDAQATVCPHCGADISEFVEAEEEIHEGRNRPACPLCKGQSFRRVEAQVDSLAGLTSDKMILLICEQCQYVLQFYEGDSIWDLD